jgi:hypothetical protein
MVIMKLMQSGNRADCSRQQTNKEGKKGHNDMIDVPNLTKTRNMDEHTFPSLYESRSDSSP